MHGRTRNWFPNNNYTSSSMPQPPMEDKRAIYRPPKGRLFHGRSDNSWTRMDDSARNQSDHVTPSSVSYVPSTPNPDSAEMSPRTGNWAPVGADSSSRLVLTNSVSSEPKMETPLSNAKGERSSPNSPKKAIYRPPKGRLFGGENENSWKTMNCITRKQSDPVVVSRVSHGTPDLVELSPRIGNLGLVDDGCSSGLVQSPSCSSDCKVKFCTSSDKYLTDDRHSSWRLSEPIVNTSGIRCKIDDSFDITDSSIQHNSSEKLDRSQNMFSDVPYSICYAKNPSLIKLKTSLFLKNRDKRMEMNRGVECQNIRILRPGMVHLRHYLPISDQVKIIETCCKHGMGPGGFYQPGYHDGRKLKLKMMCLGKDWDPQTSAYSMVRSIDGAKPPSIPDEFCKLVDRAIQDSHSYLKGNGDEILPPMTPDICIVNFYTSGGLGLHQDKDEGRESLRRGLPVVSFSIGDSAEFVYGDERDIGIAEKVILESGDVLIFGGSSRHIFHGITSINRGTAPKVLLEESNLRPGRLNLTFRQY